MTRRDCWTFSHLMHDRRIRSRYERQRCDDVAADMIAAMGFRDLITAASALGLLPDTDDLELKALEYVLSEIRNETMHGVKTLVDDRVESIRRLAGMNDYLSAALLHLENMDSPHAAE